MLRELESYYPNRTYIKLTKMNLLNFVVSLMHLEILLDTIAPKSLDFQLKRKFQLRKNYHLLQKKYLIRYPRMVWIFFNYLTLYFMVVKKSMWCIVYLKSLIILITRFLVLAALAMEN